MALFPAGASGSKPLFPAAVEESSSSGADQTKDGSSSHDRSWLQNPSFKQMGAAEEIQQMFSGSVQGDDLSTVQSPGKHRHSDDESISTSADSEGPTSPKKGKRHHKEKERRSRKHKHKERSKYKKHRRSPERAPSQLSSLKPDTIWFDESGLDLKDAYRVDFKPDRNNLHYNALYSGDVASYRRKFGSHCIGIGKQQAIEWTDNRGKGLSKEKKRKQQSRYFKGELSVSTPSDVVLHFSKKGASKCSKAEDSSDVEEYIALEHEDKARDRSAAETEPPSELTPERYLTQCTAEYNRALLENPHDVQLWLEFIAFQDEALQWGKLPQGLQDAEGSTTGVRKRNRLAIIERKTAIYERALESNPLSVDLLVGHMNLAQEFWETEKIVRRWKDLVFQQPNKPVLWLKYIEFCQTRFSSFTASSLVALYAKCISTLTAIQDGTLKSHRPDANTPRYLLTIFILYCHYLKQIGQSEKAVACFQALAEFNLCCPPELDAEDLPSKSRLEFFETFWDSGAPRFGEDDAPGWMNWMKATQSNTAAGCLGLLEDSLYQKATESKNISEASEEGGSGAVDPEISLISGLPLHEACLKLEHHRERENSLPWRPDPSKGETEEDCTDPDQIVLFDDVSQWLFRISDPALQLQLVLAFLHFLGAPLCSSSLLQRTPHHLSSCLENPSEVFLQGSHVVRSLVFASRTNVQYMCQFLGIGCGYEAVSTTTLLDLVSAELNSDGQSPAQPPLRYFTAVAHRSPIVCAFVSNVCNQAMALLSDPNAQTTVAQIWIQFELFLLAKDIFTASSKRSKELKQKLKSLQKLVKSLLKVESHRNNLQLWNMYALLEHTIGNCNEATKLYEMILSQYQAASDTNTDLAMLHQCFCECLMGLQTSLGSTTTADSNLALHVLLCLTESKYKHTAGERLQISPARVLKARSSYEQTQPRSQQDGSDPTSQSLHWCVCHAYFEYLTKGVKNACEVFDSYISMLSLKLNSLLKDSHEATVILLSLEQGYYLKSRLVMHHSRSHAIQPAVLRNTLEQALAVFPNCGWFLAAYVECEQQSFISGRIRRYFDTFAPRAETVIPWLFAISAELQRYKRLCRLSQPEPQFGGGECYDEPVTGTVHRIRGLLRKATESESGQGCPLLWRMFVKFEMEQQNLSQAKAIFYQAIHQCPWAKVLYFDAAHYFPEELDKIVEIMEEKELRLRAPLEEVKLLLEASTQT